MCRRNGLLQTKKKILLCLEKKSTTLRLISTSEPVNHYRCQPICDSCSYVIVMQQNLLNWHLVALYVSQTFYPCVHQVRDIEHNLAFHERVADLVSLFAHFVPFSDK